MTQKPVFMEGIFTLRNLRSMGTAAIIEIAIAAGIAGLLLWQELRPVTQEQSKPPIGVEFPPQQPVPPRIVPVPQQSEAPQLSQVPSVPVTVPTPTTLPLQPPSLPPVPDAGRSAPQDILAAFEAGMKQAIDAAKVYPKIALLKAETGTATVSFDYVNGVVSNVRIDNSSGDRRLDEAAMTAVQKAVMPPKPAALAGTGHFVVLISFTLG